MNINFFKKIFTKKKFKYSQAGQDLFAYELFGKNGNYIEIGCCEPMRMSNTYLLETFYGWKGYGIEYNKDQKKNGSFV